MLLHKPCMITHIGLITSASSSMYSLTFKALVTHTQAAQTAHVHHIQRPCPWLLTGCGMQGGDVHQAEGQAQPNMAGAARLHL